MDVDLDGNRLVISLNPDTPDDRIVKRYDTTDNTLVLKWTVGISDVDSISPVNVYFAGTDWVLINWADKSDDCPLFSSEHSTSCLTF